MTESPRPATASALQFQNMAAVRREALLTVLVIACSSVKARRTPALLRQQRLQMLSHWDHSFPRGDQFPQPAVTTRFSPLEGTADSARTWTPNYPSPYVYRFIKVELEPVCGWPYHADSGYYMRRSQCADANKTDVRVKMHIQYENLHGTRSRGMRCLGDSPDPAEAPDVWAGERDKAPNSRPFILSVSDSAGNPLSYHMHRSDSYWWLDYEFARPLDGRMWYEVILEYQLQRVMQGSPTVNSFSAPWLRDWSAPVKKMEIVWMFPKAFFVKSFSVIPDNQLGEGEKEGWLRGAEGEPRRITRACCGTQDTSDVEGMERCTADEGSGLAVWRQMREACKDKTVMLSTLISFAPSERGSYGAIDDDVLAGMTEYKVSFTPGLVNMPWAAAVGDRDVWGVPWWGWVVLGLLVTPLLAAVFYTLATYGAMDFFLEQTTYKVKLQGKV